jgi:predicted house-cleaning noncanonical NTP pyrophosphatase (MazG superfamily)
VGEIVYNKLVRDLIVSIIRAEGKTTVSRVVPVSDRSLIVAAKVVEEAKELQNAPNRDERIAERADLEEILATYDLVHDISREDIEAARDKKNTSKGAFKDFIYLERVVDND